MVYLLLGVFAILGVMMILVLRPIAIVSVLVLSRALADIGYAAGHAILPSGLLALSLAVLAWLAVAVKFPSRVLEARLFSTSLFICAALSILSYFYRFGIAIEPLVFFLNLSSVVPLFLLGRSAGSSVQVGLSTKCIVFLCSVPCIIMVIGLYLFPSMTVGTNGRPAGTFVHANAAGSFIAVAVTCLVWATLTNGVRHIVPLLFCLWALVLTGSLNALVTAFAGVSVVCLLVPTSVLARTLSVFLGVAGVWAALALTELGERVSGVLASDFSFTIASGTSRNSIEWRVLNWFELYELWQRSPVVGFGLGSTLSRIQPLSGPAHSLYVQLLVETGVVGLFALVLVVAHFSVYVFRVRRSSPRSQFVSLSVGVVVCLGVNGLASNLLSSGAVLFLASTVLGLSVGMTGLVLGSRLSGNKSVDRELSVLGTAAPDRDGSISSVPMPSRKGC
ncbi:O-antigen ligase family protein [Gordonia aquimaris]|uniref:O-antigen ligase family protein n=1 Tax=Gordonia aquimaris TaxID=2984863 RepID=A0A9X3D810_9ACTN|nr:O-antigen ligase family protein [Gordonia aquimaris]MCX2965386.1 O-antigen ligase family protein [Gordonia aquimaris]